MTLLRDGSPAVVPASLVPVSAWLAIESRSDTVPAFPALPTRRPPVPEEEDSPAAPLTRFVIPDGVEVEPPSPAVAEVVAPLAFSLLGVEPHASTSAEKMV